MYDNSWKEKNSMKIAWFLHIYIKKKRKREKEREKIRKMDKKGNYLFSFFLIFTLSIFLLFPLLPPKLDKHENINIIKKFIYLFK